MTRVAVDIYWLGVDWALGADKAAGGWVELGWVGYGISHYGGALPCLLRLPSQVSIRTAPQAKYLVLVGQSKIKGLQRLRGWACQSYHPCSPAAFHPTRPAS